jgi:hypothetical protein
MSSTVVIALAGLLTGSPWSNFASVWGSSVAGEDRNPPVWAWDFEVRWLAPGCHFGGPLSVGLNHCTPLYPSLVCTLSVLEVPDHSDGEPMTTKTASCHEVPAYQSSASALFLRSRFKNPQSSPTSPSRIGSVFAQSAPFDQPLPLVLVIAPCQVASPREGAAQSHPQFVQPCHGPVITVTTGAGDSRIGDRTTRAGPGSRQEPLLRIQAAVNFNIASPPVHSRPLSLHAFTPSRSPLPVVLQM